MDSDNVINAKRRFVLNPNNFLLYAFFLAIGLMPLLSLFWQEQYGIVKINWLSYPILFAALFIVIAIQMKATREFIALTLIIFCYLILTFLKGGDFESVFRVYVVLVPFTLINKLRGVDKKVNRFFWVVYILSFIVPCYNCYLQYTGKMPYYDFDVVNGNYVGRISGGYNKPMNFIAFLFPIYLYGFYLILVKRGMHLLGCLIIVLSLFLIFIIGHRTSLLSYLVIFVAAFFRRTVTSFIYYYYKYLMNLFLPIIAFIFFFFYFIINGLVDGLRGRIPMWLAHADNFFNASALEVLFGHQEVLLPQNLEGNPLIHTISEAHNNSFRTIIFFGLFGYTLYCLFMRKFVIESYKAIDGDSKKFILSAGYLFFLLYTVTNEPLYYGSVAWSLFIWNFLLRKKKNVENG